MLSLTLGGIALTGTGCAGDRYQRSTGAYIDDKGISSRVKTALFRDPNVSGFDVHVNTFRGDVQLSGFVDTPEQKEHAAALAREVSGVREVTNNLEVKPQAAVGTPGPAVESGTRTITNQSVDTPAADAVRSPAQTDPIRTPAPTDTIRTPAPADTMTDQDRLIQQSRDAERERARMLEQSRQSSANPSNLAPDQTRTTTVAPAGSISTEPLPGHPKIDVTSSNGHATIRGTVSSEDEKHSIARKLLSVPGIVTVDNQLEVQPTAPPAK